MPCHCIHCPSCSFYALGWGWRREFSVSFQASSFLVSSLKGVTFYFLLLLGFFYSLSHEQTQLPPLQSANIACRAGFPRHMIFRSARHKNDSKAIWWVLFYISSFASFPKRFLIFAWNMLISLNLCSIIMLWRFSSAAASALTLNEAVANHVALSK